ncbi:MAG: TetR/AcrR family transcriptional regulator, partial [Actinomycetota bacterium]|nr:TetR/AcrR family transcriptional regulator [Actinomycetota bacterium]
QLIDVRGRASNAYEGLRTVLEAYALISHETSRQNHGTDLVALVHQGEHAVRAQQQLTGFLRDLLSEGAQAGHVRDDVAPAELASYCLHALGAATDLPTRTSVHRLVTITLAGLRPDAGPP